MKNSNLRKFIREEVTMAVLQEDKALPTLVKLAKQANSPKELKKYMNSKNIPKDEMKLFLMLYGKQIDRATQDFIWDVQDGDWG